MCGIAGIARPGSAPVDITTVGSMIEALTHRGPDSGAWYSAEGVGLGVRRLRIIDLVTGDQPISNEDGTVWTVFNGEIYNFQALRDELSALGHTFRTRTDTECLVHGYEEWGVALPGRLRGMFALAIWDAKRRRLFLARDRMGKKPLVYAETGGGLSFASELAALRRDPAVPVSIDNGSLGDYLAYGFIPAPATIYSGVRKLLPGHWLTWQQGDITIGRYWQLRYEPKHAISEREAIDELEHRLDEAVRLRLIADVPLGALLSGGVDSSTIVALMARHSSRVRTFSVGFDERAFDELEHARRVARMYGTEHNEIVLRPDAAAVLPTLVRHYGEPYADSSAIPTFYVSKLAREHVTVALNGDGGDEAFSGYDRSRAMWLAERVRIVPGWLLAVGANAAEVPFVRGSRVVRRGARFLRAASLPAPERYTRWISPIPPDVYNAIVVPERQREFASARSYAVERSFETTTGLDPVDRVLAAEVAGYLPDDLLAKMDIASMANSLETRSPLLDQEVVEFAARLPVDMKLRRGVGQKYLLKRLASRLIPRENIERPKMGFGVPVGEWLRSDLKELASDALLSERARSRGYFVPAAVRRIWDEHQAGSQDHRYVLWTLLMLELWHREFADGPGSPAA